VQLVTALAPGLHPPAALQAAVLQRHRHRRHRGCFMEVAAAVEARALGRAAQAPQAGRAGGVQAGNDGAQRLQFVHRGRGQATGRHSCQVVDQAHDVAVALHRQLGVGAVDRQAVGDLFVAGMHDAVAPGARIDFARGGQRGGVAAALRQQDLHNSGARAAARARQGGAGLGAQLCRGRAFKTGRRALRTGGARRQHGHGQRNGGPGGVREVHAHGGSEWGSNACSLGAAPAAWLGGIHPEPRPPPHSRPRYAGGCP